MKSVIGTLLFIAAICLIWIMYVELNEVQPSSNSTMAGQHPAESQGQAPAPPQNQTQPIRPPQPVNQPVRPAASGSSQKIQQLRRLAAQHQVEILSLSEIGNGVKVRFRAKDHISTGDLLDSLTRGGAVARDFKQGNMSTQSSRDGARLYISDFEIYW